MRRFRHSFNPGLALQYGLEGAIMLEGLRYLSNYNQMNNLNFYNGRYWFNPGVQQFATIYPYWNQNTIVSTLNGLVGSGAILQRQDGNTYWYAFN